jgi:hypothetical protein
MHVDIRSAVSRMATRKTMCTATGRREEDAVELEQVQLLGRKMLKK